jgi:hypothetical protein
VIRFAVLALLLAFAHVWESVTVAEMHTRLDRERNRQDQLMARLHQVTSQLAQIRGRAEALPGQSLSLGFATPGDGQIKLVSAALVGVPGHPRLQRAPSSLWDWVAGSARAGGRDVNENESAATAGDDVLP